MRTFSIPRNIWRAVYPMLIFLGLSFLITFVGISVITVFILLDGGLSGGSEVSGALINDGSLVESILGGAANGGAFPGDFADVLNGMQAAVSANAMWVQLATNVVQTAVLFPLFRYARAAGPRYGGGKVGAVHGVMLFFAAMSFSLIFSFLIGVLDVMRFFPEYNELMSFIVDSSFLPQFLAVGIAAPVAEEICFRGLIQKRLASWLPSWVAVVISAALFGIMHLNLLQGLYAFIFGAGLSLIYIKYKTIWAPIIGHIGFNLVGILLDGITELTGWVIPDAALLISSVLVASAFTFMIVSSSGGKEK